jgi:hypothetical protein
VASGASVPGHVPSGSAHLMCLHHFRDGYGLLVHLNGDGFDRGCGASLDIRVPPMLLVRFSFLSNV